MNFSRFRTNGRMHQINIKASMESSKLSESFESSKLAELSKSSEKLLKTPTDQILNEINDSNSKYFELSQTSISTSTNITDTARSFIENSIQTLATNEFDQSIDKIDFIKKKIDFAAEKSVNFSSNIAVKNSKQTTRKRKADQSSI